MCCIYIQPVAICQLQRAEPYFSGDGDHHLVPDIGNYRPVQENAGFLLHNRMSGTVSHGGGRKVWLPLYYAGKDKTGTEPQRCT